MTKPPPSTRDDKPPPKTKDEAVDRELDEALEETFPASDPPSTLPNPDDDSLIDDATPEPDVNPR